MQFGCFIPKKFGIFAFLLLLPLHLSSAVYLKVEGVEGPVKEGEHKGWFEIDSFAMEGMQWGKGSRTVNVPKSGGADERGSLTISHSQLDLDPVFYEACIAGRGFAHVLLDVELEERESKIRYHLIDNLVRAISVSRAASGDRIETLSFRYARAEWEPKGEAGKMKRKKTFHQRKTY